MLFFLLGIFLGVVLRARQCLLPDAISYICLVQRLISPKNW